MAETKVKTEPLDANVHQVNALVIPDKKELPEGNMQGSTIDLQLVRRRTKVEALNRFPNHGHGQAGNANQGYENHLPGGIQLLSAAQLARLNKAPLLEYSQEVTNEVTNLRQEKATLDQQLAAANHHNVELDQQLTAANYQNGVVHQQLQVANEQNVVLAQQRATLHQQNTSLQQQLATAQALIHHLTCSQIFYNRLLCWNPTNPLGHLPGNQNPANNPANNNYNVDQANNAQPNPNHNFGGPRQ